MGTNPDVDVSLTLEQIEDRPWGKPPAEATRLVKTVYELRHKAVGAMDTEDLRVLLLQQESVEVLVPVALTHLEQNPLAEGDFYPGDLLVAVLKVPQAYWQQHPDQRSRTSAVIGEVEALGKLDDHDAPHDTIWQQINAFRS
ncbi:contact-dependent growth inhibition system immunity protein [Amycolatopsis sp. PS_44_ISF1]|uniref:contact-dependent growth inhibition system immunity protein n=1 Tax=Amycolatopsis sp. PS_44_ISF1 TaxID=2974917 RepID=UPI0028DD8809|nr:contact-dependent growth inhibition system immunity protein [Amycolatopsis sp. PS_44_ISF1]MDT8910053.1 contact-dependent growth inhibition system immunity protein [Amycolatopsis sp. PS_44_ISF1]